jgi:hypothetical protein
MCLVLAWLIPNHYPPWTSFYNESFSALGLCLLVLALGRAWTNIRLPTPVPALLMVAAIPGVQFSMGLLAFSSDAWMSALFISGFAIAIAAGFVWARRDTAGTATMQLSIVALVGALISSVIATVQGFQLSGLGIWALDGVPGMRPYANLGQPNNLATLLGLGVAGLIYLREQRRLGNVSSGLFLCLLLTAGTMSQSRTALLFGPLILACLWIAKQREISCQLRSLTVISVIGIQWIFFWVWPRLLEALFLAPSASLDERGLESVRFQVWPMLLDSVSLAPWHGFGWLQVGAAELAVAHRYPPVGELWLHGHNLFIELFVWGGYPLGAALSSLIIYWYLSRLTRARSIESIIAIMAVSMFGVHAMLELPHHYAYFLIPIGLWIGVLEASNNSRQLLSARWIAIPGVACVTLVVAIWWNYSSLEEDFRTVRFEALRVQSNETPHTLSTRPFVSSLEAYLRASRTVVQAGMSDADLAQLRVELLRYPYAGSMARFSFALALNGHLDEALLIMAKLRTIHGIRVYAQVKRDLSQRIEAGQTGLVNLRQALSD